MDEVGAHPVRTGTVPLWLCPLIGVASAVFGLLPWLVTGLRLPLQNLWATETPAEQMPLVLLPFSQYAIILIIVVLVVGAGTAGLCARLLGPRLPRWGVPAVAAGLLAVQVVALVQTRTVVQDGLDPGRDSELYLTALVTVAILSILVGAFALGLVAAGPKGAAVVGLSIAALAFGPWLRGVIIPFDSVVPSALAVQLVHELRWLPPVLVGAAIAWSGVRTVGRVAAAAFGLLLVWVVPPFTTAVQSAAGTRLLANRPREMADYGLDIFNQALTRPSDVVPPLVVALVIAVLGLLARPVLGRRLNPRATEPA